MPAVHPGYELEKLKVANLFCIPERWIQRRPTVQKVACSDISGQIVAIRPPLRFHPYASTLTLPPLRFYPYASTLTLLPLRFYPYASTLRARLH